MKFFSKYNLFISRYFDPVNYVFLIVKINKFRGDLSDVSATSATLSAGDTGVLELTAEMGGLAPFRQQWEDPIVESNQLSAPVLGNAGRQGSSSQGATSLPPSRRHSLPLIPGQLPPTTRNPSTSHPRSPTES